MSSGRTTGGAAASYPCPVCGNLANDAVGCPTCGLPPDPDALTVLRLNETLYRLRTEVAAAQTALAGKLSELNAVQERRNAAAARVRAHAFLSKAIHPATMPREPDQPPPAPTPRPGAPASRPPAAVMSPAGSSEEATQRTVQVVLFVLGGMLLCSAAIVFTAVAWARFGVAGRAAILATVTMLTLAVPPVATWRRLAGAAETFAVLGLLLVVLDGYAAWYVDLGGVTGLASPAGYAAGVLALAAVVSRAYAGLPLMRTGDQGPRHLIGPRFCAMVAAQPVIPLLLAGRDAPLAVWVTALSTLAAGNLAVVLAARGTGPARLARTLVAWMLVGIWLAVTTVTSVVALAAPNTVPLVAATAAAVVLAAGVTVAAGLVSGQRPLLASATALAVVAVTVSLVRVGLAALPGFAFVVIPAVVAVIALVVGALPRRVGAGPRVGAAIVVALAGTGTATAVLFGALSVTAVGFPVWRDGHPLASPPFTWQLPLAVALSVLALGALLSRKYWRETAMAGVVVLSLAIPASVALPWWSPAPIDVMVAVAAGWVAATARWREFALLSGGVALALAVHGLVVGLATPAGTAAVTLGLLGGAGWLAVSCARVGTGDPTAQRRRPEVGSAALAVAALAVPGLAAALGHLAVGTRRLATAWLGSPRVDLVAAVAGLIVVSTSVALLTTRTRRGTPDPDHPREGLPAGYPAAGAMAVSLAGLGLVGFAAARGAFGLTAAIVTLCNAGALSGVIRRRSPLVMAAFAFGLSSLAALAALLSVTPEVVAVLVGPYQWLESVWSGAPDGEGIAPWGSWPVAPAGALALVTIAAAAAVFRWRIARPWPGPARLGSVDLLSALRWAAGPAALAALTGCVAVGAPWPALAILSLVIASAGAFAAARTRRETLAWGWAALCAPTGGAGLAGSLPTSAMTMTALGTLLVVAAGCGATGRLAAVRRIAWLLAAVALGLLAFSAAAVAGISLWWSSYWVLAAAAATLGVAGLFVPRAALTADSGILETSAHALAVVALALTVGSADHAAGICALWGLAMGVRALVPRSDPPERTWRAGAAIWCALLGYWLAVAGAGVSVVEAYSGPAALLALAIGWFAMRSQPGLRSWGAFGPGLLCGILPSLAPVLAGAGDPARRLGLGVVGIVVVLVGALRRWQAPVIVGAGLLTLLAIHETVLYWDLLPRWIPLAAGGLVLVGVATTYERRRRDLARLRETVARMG